VSVRNRWRPHYPHDWDLRGGLDLERAFLHNYEFSRESSELREWVASIREGRIEEPTYWSAAPTFGWPQWPQEGYLGIPQAERLWRLSALAQSCPRVRELLHLSLEGRVATREGRAASAARYNDQLRALSIARLRVDWTARETFALLREIYGEQTPYSDVTALERAQRRAHRYLTAFTLRAKAQISGGQWFPPFGAYLIRP
jgi:hypothetical protein